MIEFVSPIISGYNRQSNRTTANVHQERLLRSSLSL